MLDGVSAKEENRIGKGCKTWGCVCVLQYYIGWPGCSSLRKCHVSKDWMEERREPREFL